MISDNPSNLPARTSAAVRVVEQDRGRIEFVAPRDDHGPTTDWRRLRSAFWRFKWLIVSVPILAAAAGYGVSRFVRPTYVARGTVWINKQGSPTGLGGDPGSQFGSDAWVDLFRSYKVIDQVVNEYHLTFSITPPADSVLVGSFSGLDDRSTPGGFLLKVDPDGKNYTLSNAKGIVVERRPVGGPIGAGLGFRWAPPATSLWASREITFTVLSPRQAAVDLLDRLDARIDRTGTFLHAELDGRNPQRTADVLNSIIGHFVDVASQMKREGLAERTRILGEQLKSAQGDLTAAETALERFRLQTIAESNPRFSTPGRQAGGLDATDPQTSSFLTTRAAMDSALRQRTAIRRVIAEAGDSGIDVSRMETLPAVMASSELTAALKDLTARRAALVALRQKYTQLNSLVVAAQSELSALENGAIPEMAGRVVAALSAREADLAGELASADRALRRTPALANTEARLQRNVTLSEALYSQLQPRFEEAQLAEGSAVPDVRPLDPAEAPQFSDQVGARELVLVAFLGGLGLAVAAAVVLDRVDPKFRYPDQVSRDFGLPILGAVPHLTKKGKSGETAEENAAFQEAIRDVRMNVEYAYGNAGPLILVVSSPGAADGKSFVAANVARSFAETGRRALLIDADLRRGELHRRCGVPRRPGLTDCLMGEAEVDSVIRQTTFPHLDIVASGTRHRDAPEMLGSQAAATLFGEFRARYDVIVCDAPPLSAGIDSFILAALSGSLLIVLRTGVSIREVMESKLKVLGRMPVRILGAVMNDVPRTSIYGYYSSYVPGYDSADETGSAVRQVIG